MSKLNSLSLRPLLATALTLLVLSACGSNAQLPTASGPNSAQAARPANQASTQTSAQAGGQASGQSSGQSSGSISAELRGVPNNNAPG